jgi:hypothetical protein
MELQARSAIQVTWVSRPLVVVVVRDESRRQEVVQDEFRKQEAKGGFPRRWEHRSTKQSAEQQAKSKLSCAQQCFQPGSS